MAISKQQAESLLAFVASAKADAIDCDECFATMAEFVEHELSGQELPAAMQAIQRHMDQCACCKDEHNALVTALKELDGLKG